LPVTFFSGAVFVPVTYFSAVNPTMPLLVTLIVAYLGAAPA